MFARTNKSFLSRWWWTIDRWSFAALACLVILGAFMAMATSPLMAERLKLDTFYFARRHLMLLGPSVAIMIAISLCSLQQVRLLAACILAVGLIMLVATPIIGVEIKGARRWLNFGGLSIQISEFIKPAFAVVTAWLFTQRVQKPHLLTHYMAIVLWMVVVGLLLLQPDLGMAVVITAIWVVEFFLMGVPVTWVVICAILCVGGITTAYYLFPHVSSRIDRFLDPSHGDCYQISRSLDAFMNGGLTGKGPGEGVVKRVLPDAHADFVFAVIGEEFGVLLCLLIVGMFAVLVFQSLRRVFQDHDLFTIMAVTGLAVQIGLQAIVNMASALHLIPTKGMTLPFLSYGGSSLLALSVAMGMLLALTRRRLV